MAATASAAAAAAAAAAAWEGGEEDEWELCNDDGFVYKRRKRARLEEDLAGAGSASATAGADEAELRRRKKEQKKRLLVKVKERYQREIDQWERLSCTLQDIEERTESHRRNHQQPSTSAPASESPVPELENSPGSVCLTLVDELLLQAEAQEAIIKDISNLCDAAEAMCKAEEERLKQPLFDLPVWASPRALMAALCDQDYCNSDDDDAHQIT